MGTGFSLTASTPLLQPSSALFCRKLQRAMSAESAAAVDGGEPQKKNHNKYRKEKPWDHDGIEHWKIDVSAPMASDATIVVMRRALNKSTSPPHKTFAGMETRFFESTAHRGELVRHAVSSVP
jgi:hypothetical protein